MYSETFQYCKEAPDGLSLLSEPVCRLQAREEGAPAAAPLHELLQDALDTHFQGLVFRERNAGRTIDAHMTDKVRPRTETAASQTLGLFLIIHSHSCS